MLKLAPIHLRSYRTDVEMGGYPEVTFEFSDIVLPLDSEKTRGLKRLIGQGPQLYVAVDIDGDSHESEIAKLKEELRKEKRKTERLRKALKALLRD